MSNRSYQSGTEEETAKGAPLGSKGEKGGCTPRHVRKHHALHLRPKITFGGTQDHVHPPLRSSPALQQRSGVWEEPGRPLPAPSPAVFPHLTGSAADPLCWAEDLGDVGTHSALQEPLGPSTGRPGAGRLSSSAGRLPGPTAGPVREIQPPRGPLSPPSSSTLSSRDSLLTLRTGPEFKPSRRPLRPQTVADSRRMRTRPRHPRAAPPHGGLGAARGRRASARAPQLPRAPGRSSVITRSPAYRARHGGGTPPCCRRALQVKLGQAPCKHQRHLPGGPALQTSPSLFRPPRPPPQPCS